VWQQAEAIYEEYRPKLMTSNKILLEGHSLGAGIAVQIAFMLIMDGVPGVSISLKLDGGLKAVSKKTINLMQAVGIKCVNNVRHKDPVPFIGWWSSFPAIYSGEERKHILDWDFKEHMAYWG
jgi:hypothetical protein